MSWISELVKVYDDNKDHVGEPIRVQTVRGQEKYITLLPIAHTSVNIPIQINIDAKGNFLSAESVPKDNQRTIIPTTLKSASRSSGIAPMPVDDKLKYLASDYYLWSKKDKDKNYYQKYLEQLKKYLDYINKNGSEKAKIELNAILQYVASHGVLNDLREFGMFGKQNNLIDIPKTWKGKEEKPSVYEVSTGSPLESFVRFNVRGVEKIERFKDIEMFNSWTDYYIHSMEKSKKGLDYISGKPNVFITDNQPKGILPSANNAKLISANDTSNYTFRGRFKDSDEAATIGYINSQKAHLALRWLIDKQGFSIGGRYFLAWSGKSQQNEGVMLFVGLSQLKMEGNREYITNKRVAEDLKTSLIQGIKKVDSSRNNRVHIMELDTSTPGRADIVYYQSFDLEQYIDKISTWYGIISLKRQNKQGDMVDHNYSLRTIANMVNGPKAKDDLKKDTVTQMVSVILGSQIVPRSILMNLYSKAIRPLNFDPKDPKAKFLGWEPTLEVTSKLFKTWYTKEGIEPMLNDDLNDRSYLYGRLLAIADVVENGVLKEKQVLDENQSIRPTNAKRYMSAFAQRPAETWKTIFINSQPYMAKSKYAAKAQKLIDHILNKLNMDSKSIKHLNEPLDGKFLIGYSQQREKWFESSKKQNKLIKGRN